MEQKIRSKLLKTGKLCFVASSPWSQLRTLHYVCQAGRWWRWLAGRKTPHACAWSIVVYSASASTDEMTAVMVHSACLDMAQKLNFSMEKPQNSSCAHQSNKYSCCPPPLLLVVLLPHCQLLNNGFCSGFTPVLGELLIQMIKKTKLSKPNKMTVVIWTT